MTSLVRFTVPVMLPCVPFHGTGVCSRDSGSVTAHHCHQWAYCLPRLHSSQPPYWLLYSLTHSCFSPLPCRPSVINWCPSIELGVRAGGVSPIWFQLVSADSASETVVTGKYLVFTMLVLTALALLLALVLPIEEELMSELPSSSPENPIPSNSNKTSEPINMLPFPGKLVEGKYNVQYLDLWVCTFFTRLQLFWLAPDPSPFYTESKTRRRLLHGARNSTFPSQALLGDLPLVISRYA